MHNLKIENYVLLGRLTENYCSEGLLQRGKGGARIYRRYFAVKKNVGLPWWRSG